jgi:hypothetical protein
MQPASVSENLKNYWAMDYYERKRRRLAAAVFSKAVPDKPTIKLSIPH